MVGESGISALEKFSRDGHNDLLYRDHHLVPEDSVLVLGGYLGDSTQKWRSLFGVEVNVVEPVHEFASQIRENFCHDDKVTVYEFALSDHEGQLDLFRVGDATGEFVNEGESITISCQRATFFLENLSQAPRLLEVNIEGGEYAVLRDILDSGQLPATLIVQFHQVDEYSELFRAQLRQRIAETHVCVFNYDWVWERWDLRIPA